MSISYHGIVGFKAKTTLPSVTSWGTNNNILKDPTKGIHTRRKDRVGQTDDVTKIIDGAGDRACEYIQIYPRGQNVMVGVQYSNQGVSSTPSGITNAFSSQQASLPYKIQNFRPPVRSQRELLPLSRMPRNVYTVNTTPELIDFSQKLACPSENCREASKKIWRTEIRPTATYRLEEPIIPPLDDVKYVIQNPIKISAHSGCKTTDITQQYVDTPTKGTMNREYYHQGSNPSNPNITSITELGEYYDSNDYIKDRRNNPYSTALKGNEENMIPDNVMVLEGKTPKYSMTTNLQELIDINPRPEYIRELERNIPEVSLTVNPSIKGEEQISSRNAYLPQRPKYGGFNNLGFIPDTKRSGEIKESLNTQKNNISRQVMNTSMSRVGKYGTKML